MPAHLPVPGIQATLKFSLIGRNPQQVTRDDTGQSFDVLEILEEWHNPKRIDLASTEVSAWYLLRAGPVWPGEGEEFVIEVTNYSDRPGWWVTEVQESSCTEDGE